jgi:hypothetical protein
MSIFFLEENAFAKLIILVSVSILDQLDTQIISLANAFSSKKKIDI